VIENRVLRRDEVMGQWRKLHNNGLRDLHSSLNIFRIIESMQMRWAGHAERMEEKRITYLLLVGDPEGKRPLVRPRSRWVDNIKMDIEDRIGWYVQDWSALG
jgi:hypothetical protein